MLLQLQRYSLNIVYKPGKELFIADTLSRAFLPNKPSTEELKSEVLSVKQEGYLIKSIEEISMVEFLPITSERLVDLRRKTELDEGLQQLKHIIKIGWPETKEEVPSEIRRYFDFKEELSIQDGILFKGNRVIVPVALRPHMITQVHSSHLGIESCLNKARDDLFWSTPSPSIGSSPVQRLFGRRTKTLLPTAGTLLQPNIMEGTEDKLKERKTKQALFYNKGKKELPELQPGDTVRMKPLPSDKEKLWRKGSVVKQVAPRSYEVDLQGTMLRRNRIHLVKTKEPSPQLDLESQENLPASSTPLPVEGPPVMQTRSGRVIHRPGRLRDFVYGTLFRTLNCHCLTDCLIALL